MTTFERLRWIVIGIVTAALLAGAAAPARAHWRGRAAVGIGIPPYRPWHPRPVPIYYYPPPVYYAPYPPPYPYAATPYPPPGWVAGHWEYRTNRWGRTVEVWVPPHLR